MTRPLKEGLDYFPLVTHFEDKVILLIAEFGASGVGILVSLYQKIYCNGYYINWNNDSLMLLSRYINEEITKVNTVITRCFDRNIFCKHLHEKYGILTSHGIQKQYLKICKESRRKNISFIKEFCLVEDEELLNVNTELTPVNTVITPVNECICTQSKVKESKGNNIYNPPYGPPLKKNNEHLPDDQCSSLENDGNKCRTEPTNEDHSIRRDQCSTVKKPAKKQNEHSQDDQCSNKHSIPVDQCSKKQVNKIKYAEFVSMTNAEYQALVTKLGDEEKVKRCIEILDNYKGANGKKYKSDYRAILTWVISKLQEEGRRKPETTPATAPLTPEDQKKREMIKSLYLS